MMLVAAPAYADPKARVRGEVSGELRAQLQLAVGEVDDPPANRFEARRRARFEQRGHTPGRLDIAAIREAGRRAFTPEYPHTLDLRRVPSAAR